MSRPLEIVGTIALLTAATVSCSSSTGKAASAGPPPTPTPGIYSRLNPNIVEEGPTYFVQRVPKDEVIKVDEKHIRNPVVGPKLEFFKEDENYYYVYMPKPMSKEELDARREAAQMGKSAEQVAQEAGVTPEEAAREAGPPVSDFENLTPKRVKGRLKLEKIAQSGLPQSGQWRSNFAVADMNGDGFLDIVAGPFRGGDSSLHIWLGDGQGHFTAWPLTFKDSRGRASASGLTYGGVAVGDIDGDGKLDVVAAGHAAGLASFFGDGKGGFRVVRAGLPAKGMSSQAVALVSAGGDGKLDLIASKDVPDRDLQGPDKNQIHVYRYRGEKGWEYKHEGIVGGFSSNSVHAWDFDGDGKTDVLTGSVQHGALSLLWKNNGDGTFAPVMFPALEGYSYHLSTCPGTFGKERRPAFVDLYRKGTAGSNGLVASGITVYDINSGEWTSHRVWVKRDSASAIFAVAMGDLDGDGLDDVVFPDTEEHKIRVFFQQPDGSFVEADASEEPALPSTASCVRVVDLNGDGKPDIVVEMTTASARPDERGGWVVYLNGRK